jgi:glycosyltransferase 2 family protein
LIQKVFIREKAINLMNWKAIKKYLPLFGVALFIYLLVKLNVTKVFGEIENLKLNYLLIAIIFVFIFFTTQTLKWFVIARKQKINVPFLSAFKINLISNFYGFITPSKIGSVMRMEYLKKYGGDTGKGLSNFAIDKVLDLTSLFVLVVLFGFAFAKEKIISYANLYIILSVFLIIFFSFLFFYKKERGKSALRFFYRKFVPENLKEKGKALFESFYRDNPDYRFLSLVFLINLINWIFNYAILYFVSLSLGINIGFAPFLVILPVSTLVAQIPITIDGLGTRELTMINLFGLFGVEAVKVLSASILSIIIVNIIPGIFAITFALMERKK